MILQTTLTPAEAEALVLALSRMSFDDFLKLSDGDDGDEQQAYLIQGAMAKIREALGEATATD